MFRKNKQSKQHSFFDSAFLLPEKLRQQLHQSWAETFYQEVFVRIPEEVFAVLYSDKDSRPNAAVNVLVGADILKNGFGWTDEVLAERLSFDLLVRHALGLRELDAAVPTLRTLYNFRRRVREYAEQSGHNLYQTVFETITDEQMQQFALDPSWQRMDSTQLLSNIAHLNRLELVLTVLQQGVKALPDEIQQEWRQQYPDYLQHKPQRFCYRLKSDEVEVHLLQAGQVLVEVGQTLLETDGDAQTSQLIERVLAEQYRVETDETDQITLRPAAEISSGSVQSPHDLDATYRYKNGQSNQGYVANLSETCQPTNPLQLIASIQTEPNNTDDEDLLVQNLDNQARRQIGLKQATVDGGFTGPEADRACAKHEVRLRPTRLRGRRAGPDRFGWEAYQWRLDEQQQPIDVICPAGQQATLQPGRKAERRLARFDPAACATCPFFQQECRVEPRQKGPTLSVTLRNVEVARLRQGMTPHNRSIRAVVEATVRSLKRPFPGSKLPVRGLIRAQMLLFCSAIVVNLRRIHRYLLDQAETLSTNTDPDPQRGVLQMQLALFGFLSALCLWFGPPGAYLVRVRSPILLIVGLSLVETAFSSVF